MPDEWETANGLNPNDKNDGNLLNEEGYTNLEVYLNSLVADITAEQYADGVPEGRIINVGETQYTEYEISGQTSNGDWSFSGGFKMNQTGTPATGSYGTIKYSANKQYKLTLPKDVLFSAVDFYGYANADGGSSYLSELNGTTYGETDYVFPARNAQPSTITHSLNFDTPFSGTLSFTTKGSQTCLKLTLHVAQTAGIEELNHIPCTTSNAIYDLQGRRVTNPQRGLYIVDGKKIIIR
jgi:hypothetical protein